MEKYFQENYPLNNDKWYYFQDKFRKMASTKMCKNI